MANQLGVIIGKVAHAFNITNHSGDKVAISLTFDFTTSTDAEIKQWLVSDRTIAIQRPMRSLSSEEITSNYNGLTILANESGKKIRSKAERVAELVNAGMPEHLAELMIDDPAKFAAIMDAVDTSTDDNNE